MLLATTRREGAGRVVPPPPLSTLLSPGSTRPASERPLIVTGAALTVEAMVSMASPDVASTVKARARRFI
jgi:hypothetical protein